MFSVALLFLLMLAVVLPHGGVSEIFSDLALYLPWLPWAFLVFWLLIIGEGLLGLITAPDKFKAPLLRWLLTVLIPPFRMTISAATPNHAIWLPRSEWQANDQVLYNRLERQFALPMLFITLLILPVIGAEIFFNQRLVSSPGLSLLVHLVTALIWFAFALEFIVMVSVAERKVDYCKQNWINIVIILLPLVAFLRTLQLFRFLRLTKAGKLLRAYRLRGVFARAMRLALMLNLIERVMQRRPDAYIRHLEQKVQDKQEELDELQAKLAEAREKFSAE